MKVVDYCRLMVWVGRGPVEMVVDKAATWDRAKAF
jgi:hypothetical protein